MPVDLDRAQTWRRAFHTERLSVRLWAALAATLLATALLATGWTGRLDTWIYDLLLNQWRRDPGASAVIVAVDDKSIEQLGRWPWPRRVHAALLDRLTEVGVRGVAMDLVLAEPDTHDPEGDRLLARAIARNRRVVMPVLPEPSRPGGPLIEVLPLPAITDAAAGLGHTDVAVDRDGVSRGIYLEAGLGSPHWPTLALALLELDRSRIREAPGGLRNGHAEEDSPYVWVRDHFVRIPFAGPAGTFGRISYVDALRNDAALELLRDRWVLIGVTTPTQGGSVHVPVAGGGPQMPGVELHANVVDMLERDLAITPLTFGWQFAVTFALILVPALLCGVPGFRSERTTALSSAFLALLASVVLSRVFHLWFPPVTALIVFAIGYVVWTLGYVRRWRRLASADWLTQLANRHRFEEYLEQEFAAARRVRLPLSLLIIDIDHFKPYNDAYGHRAGDDVLQSVAQAIKGHARRPRDLAARLGGDELALLLPETHASGAALVADAVQADIRALNIFHSASPSGDRVSVSIGIHTCLPDTQMEPRQLYEGADAALYQAKRHGRNRSERLSVAPSSTASPPTPSEAPGREVHADVEGSRRKAETSAKGQEELARLRQENKKLKLERQVLGETASWLAREIKSLPRGGADS